MAKIRDYAVTIEAAAVASTVLEMPVHETGDLLIVWFNKDTAGLGPATPSGWSVPTAWGANPLNTAGSGNYLYAKRATSNSETLTLSYTSETAITIVVSIKNCFGSTVDDAFSTAARASADDLTLPLDGGTFTPSHNNCLLIGLLGTDSGFGPYPLPGWVKVFGGDAGANSLSVSYTYQKTAASITHPGYWGATTDDARWGLLAIRDDGNESEVDAYVDRGTVPAYIVANMSLVTAADQGTWQAANSVQLLTLNGKTVTGVAGAAAADSGYNPFHAAARHIAPSSKTNLGASQLTFTSAQDMTQGSGILFGTFRPQLPRDYLDMGKYAAGGTYLRLADASDNNSTWVVAAQLSATTDPSNRQNFAIQVGQSTSTAWNTSGTLTVSAVNRMFLGGSGYYGAASVEWSKMFLLNETVLAGGTAANPINFLDVENAVNNGSGEIPLMVRNGSAATLWTRLRFGGGDPLHCSINLRTFQYPRQADNSKYLDFNVDNNVVGVEFYGKAGDTLKITNSVFTSDSPYYWRFNASHSASSNTNMSGTSVVGATVTLVATNSLSSMSFINCPSFTQNGATLTDCTFSGTKVSSASPAQAALISNSDFTSPGTGHAIEIGGTAANITLSGLNFTGYASSNGSTGNEAIFVNIASGTMDITISGGNTPSVRTAGATVNVISGATVTFTGLPTGTDIVILTAGTSTILQQVDAHGSTSYGWGYQGTPTVDVGFIKPGYIPFYIRNLALGSTDSSIPVALTQDRNYAA